MMTKSQLLWARAARLLSEPAYFDVERERVMTFYPLLNSHGLGQMRRRRRITPTNGQHPESWEIEHIPGDLEAARDELRTCGEYERGIRNTLEYFVKGRVSLSYRLKGCSWARRFNGPAPPKRSSYGLKHRVESYLRKVDGHPGERGTATDMDRYVSNGAFICAAMMAGLRIWTYQDTVNPDLRIGEPWAVAGLQPEDYGHPEDERLARFWRWVVQREIDNPLVEDFIVDTVELLYEGASLQRLEQRIASGCREAREIYTDLLHQFNRTLK